jgi:hypothetical protein
MFFNLQPDPMPQGFHRALNYAGGEFQSGITPGMPIPQGGYRYGRQVTPQPYNAPVGPNYTIGQNREADWMEAMTKFVKEQFGLKPKSKASCIGVHIQTGLTRCRCLRTTESLISPCFQTKTARQLLSTLANTCHRLVKRLPMKL